MEPQQPEKLARVRRMAGALCARAFTAHVGGGSNQPYVKVVKADSPALNERVLRQLARGDSWWVR